MSDSEHPERIAIVGMAGRFPGSDDVDAFWANLCDGVESIRSFSDEELAAAGVDASVRSTPDFVNAGAAMNGADGFDAAFFGMSAREAELTDPQHRVFLECAWSALEHAGCDPHRFDGRIGVFGGVARNTYFQKNVMADPGLMERTGDYALLLASEREYAITRVAYKLGLEGPALSVNTACSTSAVAVHLAAQSLLSGESDLALAGGARIRVPLTGGYVYEEDGILSPDGHCRPFDADARGTVAASGVAMVALRRLSDARRDGHTIYAVIRGTAVNNDGAAKIGYTAPSIQGQAAVIEEALAVAEVDAGTIGMVEAHGTGTSLGDPIEVSALSQAFRRDTERRQYCALGSLKANIGHLDAGAGVAGIIKAALSLYHEQIPPSLNFRTPNPQIDFDGSPFFVNTASRPWARSEQPRRAGVSSFGLGGTNVHVVLEEAPLPAPTLGSPAGPHQVLVLSGKTAVATKRLQDDLADRLEADPGMDLADVAYALQVGRARLPHRTSMVASSPTEAIRLLRGPDPLVTTTRESADEGMGFAFMFPGQGAQYPGMGAGLYSAEPVFAAALDECAAIVDPIIGRSLLELMFAEQQEAASASEALGQAAIAQPATFAIEYALARQWMSWGIRPSAMVGHSLGEFVAACLGGVFQLEDALRLVASRGRMMQDLSGGGMLAVMSEPGAVASLLDEKSSIAAVNGPARCVVSGPDASIDALAQRLAADEVEIRRLPIELAAHSPMMDPIVAPFRELVDGVPRAQLRIPMISTVTGRWVSDGQLSDPGYWASHVRETVRFSDAAGQLLERADLILIEVGPGQTLSSLVRQRPDRPPRQAILASLPQAGQEVDDEALLLRALGGAWVAGADVDWPAVHRGPRRRIPLPTYPFDRQRYWIDRVGAPHAATAPAGAAAVVAAPPPASSHDARAAAGPDTPVEEAATDFVTVSRKDRIAVKLRSILSDLSGIEMSALDGATSFADMGFDSLFLTQANTQFRKQFGIRITFRQLFEEAPSVESLAAFIDAKIPADAFPESGRQTEQMGASGAAIAGRPTEPTSRAADGVDSRPSASVDRMERLIDEQMRILERQRELLRSDEVPAGTESPSVAPAARVPASPARSATRPDVAPIVHADRSARGGQALSERQRTALDDLVRRHDARTPKSKRLAQRWRPRLADNRTIVGFDQAWKELVYQIVSQRSEGSRIWDVDGNEYIDTALGLGTNLLGHSPDFVVAAIREQLKRGYEVSAQSDLLGEVSEMVCAMTGNDRMVLSSSGSEAVGTAIRVARTVTGRDKVAYFSDDIHGRTDIVLGRSVDVRGELRTVPMVAGVPQRAIDDALVLSYGTESALDAIRAQASELALVLVEPVRTRNPDLQPIEFLHELRGIADERGFLLVFDEIVTGFRAHPGGVQAMFGVRPDLTTYGKTLGGGLPIAAVAGTSAYVDVIDGGPWAFGDDSFPEADITASGGTFIKHPLALAAARAVLSHLEERGPSLQADLNRRTSGAVAAINDVYASDGIPIHIEHFSSFFRPTFSGAARFAGLFHYYLREHRVHTNPPAPSFLSTAHSETDVEAVVEAYRVAGREMVRHGFLDTHPTSQLAATVPSESIGPSDGQRSVAALREPTLGPSLPLTDAQRDIWLISQLSDEASAAYHISTKLSLKGELDTEALREALRLLVDRHESLRITFDPAGEHQVVRATADAELPIDDLSDDTAPVRSERLEAIYAAELNAPYDLADGPLFRARLIKLDEADHVLVLSAHHLISDGWSLGVMQRDLGAIYSALRRGEPVPADDVPQFSEYVDWDRDHTAESEAYWLDLYDQPPLPLDLPTDRARQAIRSFECRSERALIDGELLAAVRHLAAAEGVPLFTVLLGAWQILLQRLSGQPDFALGLVVAGQASMGVRDLVGACANFVPLPGRLRPDERLSEFLARLKWSTFDAYDHQHYTVGKLASALSLARDPSSPTIVSTAITLETPTEGIRFEGLQAKASVSPINFSAFDLAADLTESQDDVAVDFHYSEVLFDRDTMQRWLDHYTNLLQQMTTAADPPVSGLRMLNDAERHDMLVRWNDTEAPLPAQWTHQLFEQQARSHPERVAIRTSSGSLTYGGSNATANRLARHLQTLGVAADRLVGVHLHREPDVVVALLAVHKAGGAYVPLDPLFPVERLSHIARDAGLHALITQDALVGTIPADGAAVVVLDRDASVFADLDDADLDVASGPSDLAYVIYTSGSTGQPKGVEVTNLALANDLTAMQRRPGIGPDDVLLAVTTMSFDPAIEEIFLPLIVGATVVLADEDQAVDAVWLRERLAEQDITVMNATPATWQMLLDAGWPGTPGLKALCGGEALSPELAAAIGYRVESLWNVYGTTETTISSSVSEVGRDGGSITLGQPIANTEFHVLGPSLELQPLGVPGDLYIGGSGLARGYRNQAGLTAERFVMHRFEDEPPRRLYRTGDQVRRLADGRIEFLGRNDSQVKIRGYRIELGEVEAVLGAHADVKECAVVARADATGSKRLVAYVVPSADRAAGVSDLRAYLRERLPEYMVPSLFVVLEALPLTANNKVDRARLPDPDHQRPELATKLVAPRTQTEVSLARIWQELLDVEQVGIDDNFFDLGGDSLLALRCIMQANRSGMNLAPISILRHQTIAELALAATEASAAQGDDQAVVTGSMPLTPAQRRFLDERGTPDPHHWNVSSLVKAADLDPLALRTALGAVILHHDALRLRLWQDEAGWRQEIGGPSDDVPLRSQDLSQLSPAERTSAIERTCAELGASFDLGQGPLLRAAHFDCGPDEADRLFVTIHHFAVDGFSWPIFWDDLEQAYRQAAAGVSVSLPPKTTSFRDWAIQLEQLVQTPRVAGKAEDWLRSPWAEVSRLVVDHEADARSNTYDSTDVMEIQLRADDTRRLLASPVRPQRVIIAALARCISDWSASPTILIDILSHGRDAVADGVNVSRTVGFMLSYDPLLLTHPTWRAEPETLRSVVAQFEARPEGFGFELLRFLSPDQALRDRLTQLPRAEVLFHYDGTGVAPRDDVLWSAASEPRGADDSPRGIRQYPMSIRASLDSTLRLTFAYSRKLYEAATVEARAAEIVSTIGSLLREP